MNDKVTKISVNLENVDSATQKIQNLNKGLQDAEINLKQVTQTFKNAPQAINDYIKTVDKLNQKGHLQGSVTSRDKQALDVRTGDINEILQEIVNVKGSNNLKADGKQLSDDTVKQLNDTANKILSVLSNAGISANISSNNGTITGVTANVGSDSSLSHAYSQTTRDYRNRDMSSVASDMEAMSSSIDNLINNSNDYIKKLNSTITNNNRTLNNIEKTQQGDKVSYNRNKQYQTFFGTQGDNLQNQMSQIDSTKSSLQKTSDELGAKQIAYKEQLVTETDSAEIEKIDKKLQEVSRLKEKVDLNITKLEAAFSRGETNQSSIEKHQKDYNEATQSGELKVGVDPNSLKGRLQSQMFNITQRSLSQMAANISSAESQGTQARTTAYNNGVSSIMFNEANNGNVSKGMDNKILKNFTELGLRNGTHYSGTELAQFGGSYASTNRTGNISDYVSQTDAISQMARYSGMDSNSANQLIQSAGLSGVTSMVGLSQTLSGALQRSNMTARSSEQAQALASIYSNTANIGNMSSTEASRTATFQGMMASTKNSALQGQQGAQAYTAMANGLTDTNSNYAREMFAMSSGNPSKYSGRGGAARLSMDMEDARQDPTKLKGVLDTLSRTSGGNKDVMSQQLQEMSPNLSMHQAEGLVGLYQKGDFSKKKVDELMKEDKSKGKDNSKAKDAYKGSGQNTIDFSIAVDEKGNVQVSKATDSIRGFEATLKNNPLGVVTDTLFNGLGMAAGGIVSGVVSSRLRGDFKFSDILSKSSGSSGGKHFESSSGGKHFGTSAVETESGTMRRSSKGGRFSGLLNFGTDIAEGVAQDYVIDKVFRGIGKLGGSFKGMGSKALSLGKKASPYILLASALQFGNHEMDDTDSMLNKFVGNDGSTSNWGKSKTDKNFMQRWGHNIQSISNKLPKYLKWMGVPANMIGGGIENIGNAFNKDNKKSSKKKSSNKDDEKSKKKETFITKQKELVTRFDKMLDKAEKTIALAKNGTVSADSVDSDGKTSSKSNDGKKKASDWDSDIKQAAKEMGQTISDSQVKMLEGLIQAESGGNADVGKGIDDGDGTGAAIGLLQYKQSTFDHYAVKGHTDINNGYDQLLAFFNNKNWASDLARNGGGAGGWGPTGSVIKHANGGFFNRATMRGSNNVIGENGLEVAIPLGADKFTRGKELLNTTANLMGQALVPQHELSLLQSRANRSTTVSPSYNLSVTVGNDTTPEDTYNQVLETLNNTQNQQSYENELLNYYAQDVRGI